MRIRNPDDRILGTLALACYLAALALTGAAYLAMTALWSTVLFPLLELARHPGLPRA